MSNKSFKNKTLNSQCIEFKRVKFSWKDIFGGGRYTFHRLQKRMRDTKKEGVATQNVTTPMGEFGNDILRTGAKNRCRELIFSAFSEMMGLCRVFLACIMQTKMRKRKGQHFAKTLLSEF